MTNNMLKSIRKDRTKKLRKFNPINFNEFVKTIDNFQNCKSSERLNPSFFRTFSAKSVVFMFLFALHVTQLYKLPVGKKCPYYEIFSSAFSCIWTKQRHTEYLSVFSPNTGEYGPGQLQIRKLFTQCNRKSLTCVSCTFFQKFANN